MKTRINVLVAVGAAFALVCALPTFAFAAQEGGISKILPDMNEFVPMLVAFIIIVVVLAKFGWPMFEGIMVRRETTIKENLEKSEAARIESEKLLEEYQQQLADAKMQASMIVADARRSGETLKADIEAKAQSEANAMIEKARVAIEAEKKQAVAQLQGSVADFTVQVAGRVIGESLSDDEHRAIIERYVNEAGSLNAE